MANEPPLQTVELDLRGGITTNESAYTIGPRLHYSGNSVWNYRYPKFVGGLAGPWMHRMPIGFPIRDETTYTSALTMRDIGYTLNSNIISTPAYITVMGADTSNAYRMWKASGGTAISYASTITPFTVSSVSWTPGCSTYWELPGYNPRTATTGVIDLDYSAAARTITRTGGSFITDGFAEGDSIVVTLSNNNDGTYTIAGLTATVITLVSTNSLTDESGASTSTITLNPLVPDGIGVLVFSHSDGNAVYYMLDNSAVIRSLTADVTNCPEGARALCVHLDRLWLGFIPTAAAGLYSYIYYTNPNDLNTIFSSNVIRIPGSVTCLIPGQFGAIDATGIPHLIIGTAEGILVLDGDPIVGGGLQADLRILSKNVGIPNPNAAVTTQWGTFILGNDGQLWRIPPGAQTMVPVGEPIEDRLGRSGNFTDSLSGTHPCGSIVWFDPYLYIFPGGRTDTYWIAEPTDRAIKFWGSMTLPSSIIDRTAIVKQSSAGSLYSPTGKIGTHPVHSIGVEIAAGKSRFMAFDEETQPTGSYPDGSSLSRTSTIQSGLINVPGHKIQVVRVTIESLLPFVTSNGTTPALSVKIFDERNNQTAGVRQPEAAAGAGSYSNSGIYTQHFTFPSPLSACRGVAVQVTQTTEASLAVDRVLVTFKVIPATF